MRRDWIIAANMEYQPLRHRFSGHGLTRDYPRIHRVTRYPRVNRPVIQRHSEASDTKGCQERNDSCWGNSYWGRCVDLFCPPYPNRSNNSVDRRGLACWTVWQCSLSSTGRVVICGEMPFGKFQPLAACTIAPYGGAFEF